MDDCDDGRYVLVKRSVVFNHLLRLVVMIFRKSNLEGRLCYLWHITLTGLQQPEYSISKSLHSFYPKWMADAIEYSNAHNNMPARLFGPLLLLL